ncbi:MAG: Rieske 2Fe-2S domain-containing protein [Dehalococcoidia bacterium]|nr:Rieske 2Fe-2S domain-containing protein [Dehalococcoidia bacterium]
MADEETNETGKSEESSAGKPPAAKRAVPARAADGAGVGAVAAGHAVVIAQPAPLGPALPQVSRRGVLKVGFWAGLGVMLATIGTTIIYALYPRRAPANGGQQRIGTSEVSPFGGVIPVGTLDQLEAGQKIHNLDARAWLVRFDEAQAANNPPAKAGMIIALYHKCPHLGCTVPWRPDFSREDPRNSKTYAGWFLCPCHGSTYSDAGVRVFGPAPRSMDTFALTITGGRMVVDTSKITLGATTNPTRAINPG